MITTDLSALRNDGPDYGVGIVRDSTTGDVAIVLDADRAAALAAFLDGLDQYHDLIEAGFDPAGVDVILVIKGMLMHHRL